MKRGKVNIRYNMSPHYNRGTINTMGVRLIKGSGVADVPWNTGLLACSTTSPHQDTGFIDP